ncbi:MAG: rod shape-determining protein MreC [Chitinophagales bacterium]
MRNLILFIFKYHAFLLFLCLEIVSYGLIVRHNHFQRASFVNSSQSVVSYLYNEVNEWSEYMDLKQVNDSLMVENARLMAEMDAANNFLEEESQANKLVFGSDTTSIDTLATTPNAESSLVEAETVKASEEDKKPIVVDSVFHFISAKVINNSTNRANNFLTINKGSADGIKMEMGVIGEGGVVGVVKDVSENFSTIISLLHRSMRVSAKIKRNNFVGSLRWEGTRPDRAVLNDIPKHVHVEKGDTILTSGYSSFFPQNVMIGIVIAEPYSDQGSNFYKIDIALSTSFNSIHYVYVVDYNRKAEKKELEEKTQNE